jgi:ribonuclease P/MRP protein subunit RPP40
LYKMKGIGIIDPLIGWFDNYLLDRKQRVVLDGYSSRWRHTSAGVPQGSVLGPILFLIFINDINSGLVSDIRLFTDDTALFVILDENSHIDQAKLLQDDLITVWDLLV